MCDDECQNAQYLANAKEEAAEAQNIILLVTFFLLVCLVYVTGLIVWVWCNRNPSDGINAIQQTDRLALKNQSGHCRSRLSGKYLNGGSSVDSGMLLLLGALVKQQCPLHHHHHPQHLPPAAAAAAAEVYN